MKQGERNWLWVLMAFFYDQVYKRFPPYQKLLREIIKNIDSPQSSWGSLLDAGCGTGLISVELARHGYIVVGIDRSPQMIKRARKKKQEEKLDNLLLLQEDLNIGISVQNYSFQKILFIHSLYLLHDPGMTLQNLASTLSEDGEIIMCNPCRRITLQEFWAGARLFLQEAIREKGFPSFFFFLATALAMGALNFVIQRRKTRVYHCWDEKGMRELLKSAGFKVKWLQRSCLANTHLLLCAVKER
jgi:SAM-dependent methyltransferase